MFTVIVGTCLVYGLGAPPLARALKVAEPEPDGVLLVGDQPWMLALADLLSDLGESVTVLATGQAHLAVDAPPVAAATVPLIDRAVSEALATIRTAVLASDDDEHNALALTRCVDVLARKEIYLLPSDDPPMRTTRRVRRRDAGWTRRRPRPRRPPRPGRRVRAAEELEAGIDTAPARGWERRPFTPGHHPGLARGRYEAGGLRVVTDARHGGG